VPGYVNVDFEDVNTVMRDSGVAIMGTATAEGENRAKKAVDEALNSPLLEDNNIRGAQHILLNITSGTKEVTMDEIFEITEFVQEEAGYGTDLIWGNCFDEKLGEKLSVTVIATGFERQSKLSTDIYEKDNKIVVSLDEESEAPAPKKNHIKDIGFEEDDEVQKANTFEFEDVEADLARHQARRYSYREPYLSPEDQEKAEAEMRERMQEEARRRERLRSHQVKLSNPNTVSELENEPAYLRRGVPLDDVPGSNEPARSRWSINEEDEIEMSSNSNNSYLHDNVD
jgi:cell division protein FtsZ